MRRNKNTERTKTLGGAALLEERSVIAQRKIKNGEASPELIRLLLDALEGFNDGTLTSVACRRDVPVTVMTRYNLPVTELALGREDTRKLLACGIRHIGELYYVHFNKDPSTRRLNRRIFEWMMKQFDLPPTGSDPLRRGWRPPYWNDPHFLSALNLPLLECLKDPETKAIPPWPLKAQKHHSEGTHYLGQLLQELAARRTLGKLKNLQSRLTTTAAWAGALLPPDWVALSEEPPIWLEHKPVVEKARRQRAREHLDQRVEWKFSLATHTSLCCQIAGLEYYRDLATKTEQDLRKLGFGKREVNEVKSVLEAACLHLGMTPEEINALRTDE